MPAKLGVAVDSPCFPKKGQIPPDAPFSNVEYLRDLGLRAFRTRRHPYNRPPCLKG